MNELNLILFRASYFHVVIISAERKIKSSIMCEKMCGKLSLYANTAAIVCFTFPAHTYITRPQHAREYSKIGKKFHWEKENKKHKKNRRICVAVMHKYSEKAHV